MTDFGVSANLRPRKAAICRGKSFANVSYWPLSRKRRLARAKAEVVTALRSAADRALRDTEVGE